MEEEQGMFSDPKSCTRQLIVTAGVLRMTKANRVAAQEGVSGFEVQRMGLKDAPQDKDCYQVRALNIETSLFEVVRMF